MDAERALFDSARQGTAVSLAFAFIFLLFTTRNLVVACITIFCICIPVSTLLAVFVRYEWQLGVMESIGVILSIGLAVDFTVHLAADYTHSQQDTRYLRMEQAYRNMGVSIMGGTLASLSVAAFLFAGQLAPFSKYAVMMSCTVGCSFFTSMLLFGALSHWLGPEAESCYDAIARRCRTTTTAVEESTFE